MTRKEVIKQLGSLALLPILTPNFSSDPISVTTPRSYKHSVCRWPYSSKSLEEICEASKSIGIDSVELLDPKEWSIVKSYGLECAMANGSPLHIKRGFNDPSNWPELWRDYEKLIPLAAEAGIPNIICFSGNRAGLSDDLGLENCAKGLEKVTKWAEKYGITVCMELLNSKVDHSDYQCDHTPWGVQLCEKIGSDRFKLLYDIYHMQIMEGDIIATITKYHPYIGHYHTGGVPGRHEIDESQELYYPAIMQAISSTGFSGYVAQEFIPSKADVFDSLKKAVKICN